MFRILFLLCSFLFILTYALPKRNDSTHEINDRASPSLADAVVNVQHFTQFVYEGNQIYVYSAKINDEYENRPLKWSFYYVPVLQPLKSSDGTEWAWTKKNEIRMKLTLGNDQVEDAARRAIARRYDTEVATNYSRFWIVAPLMIDSMTAFIVKISGEPAESVAPYRLVHPNALSITFRFECSSADAANTVVEKLIDGDYEVEVNFYFAGFRHGPSNTISITAEHLKSVLSKTIADGGNSNAKYIHRDQANMFINKYATNVKKIIYIEKPGTDIAALTSGLDEQLQALLQQGLNSATQTKLSVKLYDQVWHSDDLSPDRLTREINKLFTLNDTATRVKNDTDLFFNVNSESSRSSSSKSDLKGQLDIFSFLKGSSSLSSSSADASSQKDDQTMHNVMSTDDIQHRIGQHSIEIQWTGQKFEPKSFSVFRLTDLTDKLQVAIISKYIYAEKQNGAISRRVSVLNQPISVAAPRSSTIFIGEIRIFAGASSPPFNWLICNGSVLLRIEYPKLFDVIGTLYGLDNENETHFRLPDLRGRVPIGVDQGGIRLEGTKTVGKVGGEVEHVLKVDQLPLHDHDRGDLTVVHAGDHTHGIHDPGHVHHIAHALIAGYGENSGPYGVTHDKWLKHVSPDTERSHTGIGIHVSGGHGHQITGRTGSTGSGQKLSLLQPFQTFNYIIYVGN